MGEEAGAEPPPALPQALASFIDAFEGSLIPAEDLGGLPAHPESSDLQAKWLRAEKRKRSKKGA